MATGGDENLISKIISDKFVLPHWHVGEPGSIQLMVYSIDVVRSGTLSANLHIIEGTLSPTYVLPYDQK